MFKINNKGTRKASMTSSVFIVKFENISHLFLVFLFSTFGKGLLLGLRLRPMIVKLNDWNEMNPFHATGLFLYPLKISEN